MIWQPVDTEAFQKKKISIPLPTASASPVINDTSHSVTDKEHRRGTSVMYGPPEQEINFFFYSGEKKTLKELTRTLSGAHSKDLARETGRAPGKV